ncbi:MAG: universal stress protein [Flavobacteriales bacterium]|nr:universal stress protein [Flavobacteriales bacterium]
MENLLVLVDFTDTANVAIDQAIALAKKDNARITICHIVGTHKDEHTDILKTELDPFVQRVKDAGVSVELAMDFGDLHTSAQDLVSKLKPDLVVVGTHGREGVKQELFGSNIYKLVRDIPGPTLVVNDNTKVSNGGFKKVMLPVAPHSDFLVKVEQTCHVVAKDGVVVIYAIIKPGVPLDDEILSNIEKTKKLLDDRGVKWQYMEDESDRFSVGYSGQTLDSMVKEEMDLITIMANVSSRNLHFGKMDKENVLLNEQGLPVLCANY